MGQEDEGDWARGVANALSSRGPLPAAAAQALARTMHQAGVSELSIVLASGDAGEMEEFILLAGGTLHAGPLAPETFCASRELSAAQQAMTESRLVKVDATTPGRDELADWRRLHANGADVVWLMAAPRCPEDHTPPACSGGGRLVGAVLAGGRGCCPTLDERWLQAWAVEMGGLIRHASIELMENSLEMLGLVFPPRVLEQLVANAAKKAGQVDLAQVLRSALPSASHSPSPRSNSSASPTSLRSLRTSADSRPPLPAASGSPSRLGREATRGSPSPRSVSFEPRTVTPASLSPFAAHAGSLYPAERSSSLSTSAAELLRQASQASSAAAMLRELSQHSSLSSQLQGRVLGEEAEVPMTPHTLGDMAGFEDILQEDHRASLERRPSMAPERARSQPSACLEQCIASATAAMEEAGGLDAAARAAEAEEVARSAAMAATSGSHTAQAQAARVFDAPEHRRQQEDAARWAQGRLSGALSGTPPHVRVPWQRKPLVNPLTGSGRGSQGQESESPLDCPQAFGSDFGSSLGSGSTRFASVASQDSQPPGEARVPHLLRSPAGSRDSAPSASSKQPSADVEPATSAQGGAGSAVAQQARQGWDLGFASPALEAGFRRWLASHWLHADTSFALVQWLVLLTAAVRAVSQAQVPGANDVLVFAGLLLIACSTLPAWLRPDWWAARRTVVLCTLRLVVTLLLAAQTALKHPATSSGQAAGFSGGVDGDAGVHLAFERMVVDSGAAALTFLPLRFPVPFSVHLPLHLLCLWVMTAAAGFARSRDSGAASALVALLAQLLISFLLSSILSYWREQRLRSGFLGSRCGGTGAGRTNRQKRGMPPLPAAPAAIMPAAKSC